MSTLKVNAIEKKDADQTLTVKDATLTGATITTGTFPAGHILQVEYEQDNSFYTTSLSTWTQKHPKTITITPLKATSNILLTASFGTYCANTGYAVYDFYKNATDVTETYNVTGLTYGLVATEYHSNTWSNHVTMTWLDPVTENSTSTKTYGISVRHSAGTQAVYVGWGASQLLTITAMEIAG